MCVIDTLVLWALVYTVRVRTGPGKPGKSWNFLLFGFQAWKVMEFDVGKCVCSRAAYYSELSDMPAGKHITLWQDVNLLGLYRSFP